MGTFKEWRVFLLVAAFGCVGASVAFAIQATDLVKITPAWDHQSIQIAFQILIGAFTSTIFIFLLSNTDRSDLLRLVCLSMVAGFLWSPVLEIIKKYEVVNKVSEQQAASLERKAAAIQTAEASSGTFSNQEVDAFIKDYSIWRPILSPNDAAIADQAFEGVTSSIARDGQLNLPAATLEMLEAFRFENPGVAVIEDFPGISGSQIDG
jgi:hypothetical protein